MKERDALRQAFERNPKMARELMKHVKPSPPDENEDLTVLCMKWPGLVDDCRKVPCVRCECDVAIAPSTQEMVDKHKGQVLFICMECMAAPVH